MNTAAWFLALKTAVKSHFWARSGRERIQIWEGKVRPSRSRLSSAVPAYCGKIARAGECGTVELWKNITRKARVVGETKMTPEYLIQALDISNHWHIVANERCSHTAQAHMRDYRKAHPDLAFRILEYPPRTLVRHDPPAIR